MSRAGVFLDRDGVLNAPRIVDRRPYPPRSLDELEVLPGVPEALQELHDAGLALIAVTNQPDIARGTTTESEVGELNDALRDRLGLDEVVVCPHDDADACSCRKPLPGMIVSAALRWDLDLGRSVTVGDRWKDIEAGRAAGTRTVFIDRNYDEPAPSSPDLTVSELHECVPWILETTA